MSNLDINWPEILLGTFLGSILVPFGLWIGNIALDFLKNKKPLLKLLGNFSKNQVTCKIFVRDLFVEEDTKLISVEPRKGAGLVPNIGVLWPEVEGLAVSYILNLLGRAGKTRNIQIVKMSQDKGEWNSNIIVLGAQAQKSYDFFNHMKKVAYSMDGKDIYDQEKNIVERESGFGYGLILKSYNPYSGSPAFLIGGFGTLGTLAAAYYFRTHHNDLGSRFGNNFFGVVVRCPISAGEEAVERVEDLDVEYKE